MNSIFEPTNRQALRERIGALDPRATARWGRMTAPAMVCHLLESARMALGELPVKSKRLPIRYPPFKQLIVYWLPFPKGAPTAPELMARVPAQWQSDIDALQAALDRAHAKQIDSDWPEHPAFGVLTGRAWGVLIQRHTDHHLKQFGA